MARQGASIAEPARRMWRGVLDALVPQTCAACGEWQPSEVWHLCRSCAAKLAQQMDVPYCRRCGRTAQRVSQHDGGCAFCRTERFWNVAGVARVGIYTPEIQQLTVGLKYAGRERNAEVAGALLASAIQATNWRGERGLPGARADALAPAVDSPAGARGPIGGSGGAAPARADGASGDARSASAQPGGDRVADGAVREREGLLHAARTLRPRASAGKRVCIIDNLLLSGATVHEVSKALRRAGAQKIYAAVVARSTLPADQQPFGISAEGETVRSG